MPKKRAFVRYTKSGEIVPGSLIVTTNGGYPDKTSLWQEVTVDKCCDSSQEECTRYTIDFTENLDTTVSFPTTSYTLRVGVYFCNTPTEAQLVIEGSSPVPINTLEELITFLNQSANIFGEYSIYNNGSYNQLRLVTSCCFSSTVGACEGVETSFAA